METSTPEETPTEEPKNYGLLAKEAFGSDYHGKVIEPEIETEQTDDVEVETPTEEVTPEAEQEAEETTISSLSDLLETEGYDQKEFLSLEVEQKIDGETQKVKLSDVLATHQTLAAAEKRLEEVKDKAKSQNQALADQKQELDQAFNVAATVLQKQKSGFDAEEEALNKDPLRTQDPAEWTAKKQELTDRRKVFDSELLQFLGAYQQQKQKSQAETEQESQAKLLKEQESLLEQLPEWADEETKEKEQKRIGKYLAELEVTPESYAAINSDHKLLIMARKADLYDEIQSKAEPAKKKLVRVPKTLKPGSKPAPVDTNQTTISELQAKIDANPNSAEAERLTAQLIRLRRGNKQ
jgi:hypothetical protein